eukprot:TRINITY_DN57365_c0_g1_i1.p1 TRINITY_DN57365_c0_g1~~TRINITY_DN57365_c0_g1_i1.p1  ORF type:complete len:246 (+),score=58.86 TRINITY_DN57365_c0_g1_i1:73-738(+)
MDRFLCCCVNTSSQAENVSISGDLVGPQSSFPEASFPLSSATPQLKAGLQGQQDPDATPMEDTKESGGMNTARSTMSASSMSPEEKEKEKGRLQRLVKEFAKEAVTGIAVTLVNPETARQSPHFFQMDRYLTVFSLKPKDGSTADSAVQDFNVKDLTKIYKGPEVLMAAPSLGTVTPMCVALDTNRADRKLFFHFEEPMERDKFYTCLKILRMSVDINQPS